jgi:DNA-binding transcriptional LysR family regulator
MQMLWIQSFLTVEKHRNFSLAADELFLAQSTLSKHIKSLESELQVELFNRSTRRVGLTPAGERFLAYARPLCSQYCDMLASMKSFTEAGVHIAYMPATIVYGYENLFLAFSKDRPGIKVRLSEYEMDEAIALLRERQVDFALIRSSLLPNPKAYHIIPFHDDTLVVLCNRDHPFAKRDEISLAELVRAETVLMKSGMHEYVFLMQKYNIPAGALQPSVLTSKLSMIKQHLLANAGVSFMVRQLAAQFARDRALRIVEIAERPQMSLGLTVRSGNLTEDCRALIAYVKDCIPRADPLRKPPRLI